MECVRFSHTLNCKEQPRGEWRFHECQPGESIDSAQPPRWMPIQRQQVVREETLDR
jgi:hypothetical protein